MMKNRLEILRIGLKWFDDSIFYSLIICFIVLYCFQFPPNLVLLIIAISLICLLGCLKRYRVNAFAGYNFVSMPVLRFIICGFITIASRYLFLKELYLISLVIPFVLLFLHVCKIVIEGLFLQMGDAIENREYLLKALKIKGCMMAIVLVIFVVLAMTFPYDVFNQFLDYLWKEFMIPAINWILEFLKIFDPPIVKKKYILEDEEILTYDSGLLGIVLIYTVLGLIMVGLLVFLLKNGFLLKRNEDGFSDWKELEIGSIELEDLKETKEQKSNRKNKKLQSLVRTYYRKWIKHFQNKIILENKQSCRDIQNQIATISEKNIEAFTDCYARVRYGNEKDCEEVIQTMKRIVK